MTRERAVLRARRAATGWAARTGFGRRAFGADYRYAFTPEQLWTLCSAASEAFPLGAAFAELGVHTGETTLFLHKHLATLGPLPTYLCLDTFDGFTEQDQVVERERGKQEDLSRSFKLSSRSLFESAVRAHGLEGTVRVIQADAATYDYETLPALGFAFADLDVLRPMRAALRGCWERLVPGGILVADDCQDDVHTWDGAREAYVEFCAEEALPVDVRAGKLGFCRKPA